MHSHLSEEERRIIRIEIGNGTSIRRIAGLIGRRASTVSRGIKRNLHRPVPVVPARRQREPQRRDPPLPAQAHAHRPVHGRRDTGHRGRDRRPSHARARLRR
ncbi:helix-turn-helix domain-containing protein [Bifidobacterium longum]|uniref:helix-turn-helix domain-containing protein n=1 Tax=Bifidobacterium longum TaxID=216816 RepID=UPI002E18FAC9